MPTPPNKRRGQQSNKYFQILDFRLHLVNNRESTNQENQDNRQKTSPGGHRSNETDPVELIDCWFSLSVQERQVTYFTCWGYKNNRIAYEIGISQGTVNFYLQRVFNKANVRSKVDLRLKFFNFNFEYYLSRQ